METVVGHLTNTFTIGGITLGPRERNGNTSCEEEERGVQVAAVCGGEVDTALRETGQGRHRHKVLSRPPSGEGEGPRS